MLKISRVIWKKKKAVLLTRCSLPQMKALRQEFPQAKIHELARVVRIGKLSKQKRLKIKIGVLAAGTSDLFVAEESAEVLEFFGFHVERIYDVGVAGLHRLLKRLPLIRTMNGLIVVAGMEAALASVVGGLVAVPLIGVPTSVGYGTHGKGKVALAGMLNSCASGLTVVNIDNGFGAAIAMVRIFSKKIPKT